MKPLVINKYFCKCQGAIVDQSLTDTNQRDRKQCYLYRVGNIPWEKHWLIKKKKCTRFSTFKIINIRLDIQSTNLRKLWNNMLSVPYWFVYIIHCVRNCKWPFFVFYKKFNLNCLKEFIAYVSRIPQFQVASSLDDKHDGGYSNTICRGRGRLCCAL